MAELMNCDLFPNLDAHRSKRALRTLAEAGREALEFFEAGHFDAAQIEVDRCRKAVRELDEIRREQKRNQEIQAGYDEPFR